MRAKGLDRQTNSLKTKTERNVFKYMWWRVKIKLGDKKNIHGIHYYFSLKGCFRDFNTVTAVPKTNNFTSNNTATVTTCF